MSKCSKDGCGSKARTKGLCHKHYNGEWRKANVEQVRAYQRSAYTREEVRDMNLRHLYGISLVDFNAMAEAQGGLCKTCRRPPRDKKGVLHVDHRHVPGQKKCQREDIRGLVCLHCNVLIGKAETHENPVWVLKNVIDYLAGGG